MTAESVFQKLNTLFSSNPEASAEKLLEDLFASFNVSEFSPLHKSPSKLGLVRARCMVQDSRGTEFVSRVCNLRNKNEEITKTTMILRDGFGEDDGELVSCDLTTGRHCYSMVEVPGATQWFIEDFATDEGVPEKKSCADFSSFQNLPNLVAKFIGDASEDLKPNTVLDIFGILSHHELHLNEENEAGSTNRQNVPNLHVIKYNIVDAANYDDIRVPQEELKCVRHVLKQKLTGLVGDETSAEFLLANILSSTYSRAGGMPICSIPVNLVGVQNAEPIVDFLQKILPKVKWLQLTPALLSDIPFAPVKDYNTETLQQGELQLSNGTLLVIDETQLPEGSFPVSGHVEANLKVFEQLIMEQRINYDYGFYKIPFDVDIPILILSRNQSRILKTPYCVPFLPAVPNSNDSLNLNDPAGLAIVRKYIQTVRRDLRNISITAESSTGIQEGFVELSRSLPKELDRADLLNELLILCRVWAASEGSTVVDIDTWKKAVAVESERKEAMNEFAKVRQ